MFHKETNSAKNQQGGGFRSRFLKAKNNLFQTKFSQDIFQRGVTVFCCVGIIVFGIALLSKADPVTTSIGQDISTNNLALSGNVTSGTWQGTAIDTTHGGTGQDFSAATQGSLPYFSATGALSALTPGIAGQFLQSGGAGANPSWTNVTRAATFVIAASDSSTKSKQQADYVCDGTSDQVEIQAAIDALPQVGGSIKLMEGNFNISNPITISRSGVSLQGSGRMYDPVYTNNEGGTVLRATGNITILNLTYTTPDFTKIEDMVIKGNSTSNVASIGVAINEADDVSIYNTYITNNYYGIYINGAATNPTISFNFIEGNNYGVYGSETAGLKIINNVAGYNITSDVAVSNIHTYFILEGNAFMSQTGAAIVLDSCQFGAITGNVFWALSTQPQINILSTSGSSLNNSIVGNTFYDGGFASPFLKIDAGTDNIIAMGNNIYKTGSDSKIIIANGQNANGIISGNVGYVTENSGTSTITAGQTSVTVTHSLATTPTRVQLTPTTLTGGKDYYISAKTATTFTITIDSAHTADITFDWRGVVGEGN